ncbi:PfkB family carbohydrate kinase [Tamlana sp. 2201CG12-4]|uniref:carbohydrate kinase family protein n=1 Tax=Tamlana sp. 2201CG12-4 TaxID=3112582 RepID=UPI002DB9D2B6|nr:PfkB family carbohydrate kinase [Tamlana sp. 2201CG12-4]MEC3908885.1 PfkB family carbohydrate kinase [Tamlana sp. 2201CG12-4]
MTNDVFVVGGASYNSVITLEDFPKPLPQTIHNCHFKETIGNTGAGKALTLSRLGFKTILHSLIGKDEFGSKVLSYLQEPNLKVISDIDPNGTERHLNILNARGERISIFTNPSSDNPNIDYNKFEGYVISSKFVVINIANYCRHLLPICEKLKKPVWTDLHDYDGINQYHQDFIDAADYIFLSSENLPNYKSFMQTQIDNGKKLVVCTHGKYGATAYTNENHWIEIPIINSYELKNSNGAGDAFFSGFLYGFSKGYEIERCMKFGSITAGLCIESDEIASNKLSDVIVEMVFLELFSLIGLNLNS